jgi:hypothetical protein
MLHVRYVFADNMESSTYRIQMGTINIGGNNETSDTYKLSTSLGQTAANEFSSSGYIVKAGFQYIHSIIPFRFSLSSTNINLGTLSPNTPSTATTTLTVYFGGAGQYIVTASEEGPLQTLSGSDNIPDTSCNGGGNTCSESTSKVWNSSSAYGFGYNMAGNDIPADFTDSTYYRPFPNRLASESPVTVMSSTNVGKNRQSTMTFKANVSNLQAAGTYQTVIKFVATPSY